MPTVSARPASVARSQVVPASTSPKPNGAKSSTLAAKSTTRSRSHITHHSMLSSLVSASPSDVSVATAMAATARSVMAAPMSALRAAPVSVLRWIGRAILALGMHTLVIRLNGRAPRVLVYHACDETESDFTRDLRVNTTPRLLEAHLDFLTAHYNVVPLEALTNGGAPERALAITFDDGYRSVLTGAVPLLRRRSLPATAYVVTDVVDNGALVWVNELCWLLHRHADLARKLLCPAVGLS